MAFAISQTFRLLPNLICVVLRGQTSRAHLQKFHRVCTPVIWIAVLSPLAFAQPDTGSMCLFSNSGEPSRQDRYKIDYSVRGK